MNGEQEILSVYFPLWGATFDSNKKGILGESFAVFIPEEEKWKHIQKKDVLLERFRSTLSMEPSLCLVGDWVLNEDENIHDRIERMGSAYIKAGEDAVLALRLAKSGWFLTPTLSEVIFNSGPNIWRLPGPYRQAFLAGIPSNLLENMNASEYHLSINEFTGANAQGTFITRIWHLINVYRQGKQNSSIDVICDNFHRSYGYQLTSNQRMALLFTVLDAMFGGMSARNIGNVRLKRKFKQRIEAALEIIQDGGYGKELVIKKEVEWLDSHLEGGGRSIRNAIAHGRLYDVNPYTMKSWERLQNIIRVLILQFLEFSVKWPTIPQEVYRNLSIPISCTATGAYNKILEAYLKGNKDVVRLIQLDISLKTREGEEGKSH